MRSWSRGWGIAALLCIPGIIALALRLPDLTPAGALLLLLCAIVIVAASTSLTVAVITAIVAFLLTNWFLIPPYRTLFVASTDDVVVLIVFLGSAVTASLAVTRLLAGQRRLARAALEAGELRESMRTPVTQADPREILNRIADIYRMAEVELVAPDGRVLVAVQRPVDGETEQVELPLSDGFLLRGRSLPAIGQDVQVLSSLAQGALRAYEARALADEAARAAELDRDRSALLASVSHDLRTPLAAISVAGAALTSDVALPDPARRELAAGIVESAHTLDRLVTNLLDMSRLEAGQVVAQVAATDVDAVCAAALTTLGNPEVRVEVPEGLPAVQADAILLERVLANLVSNALRHGAPPVEIRAEAGDPVRVSVVDHGPGLDAAALARAFEPFGSSGDRAPTGLGLGLTIAQRFCQVMGAGLQASTTPGGGLTMTVELVPAP